MWIIDKYRRWKRSREDYVIAQAVILGADIHTVVWHVETRHGLQSQTRYRAYAPVHGEMGDVTVYGKTVYECAKKWMKVQEIV